MLLQCTLTAETMPHCVSGLAVVMFRLGPASRLIRAWFRLPLALQGLDEYKAQYAVDEVHYTEHTARVLSGLNPITLHLLCGTNSDR